MRIKGKIWVVLILGFILIGAGLFYRYKGAAQDQPLFRLGRVERGTIRSTVSSSGTLNAVVTVKVGSQVSGQVKELLADYNSEVRRDQVIARIDPENFMARVRQAEAEVEVARANLKIQEAAVERARADLQNAKAAFAAARAKVDKAKSGFEDAKRDLSRKRSLYRTTIISKSDMDKAQALYDQALAQLEGANAERKAQASLVNSKRALVKMAEGQVAYARAQLKQREAALYQSKVDLEHTIIRSPVDGVVIERNVDMGQTVAASLQAPTLFTIAQDLRQMQVETDIDEADIGRIRLGQHASFTVDAYPGEEFEGRVVEIRKAPKTLQNVVTYTVIISAENPEMHLLPGMTANVKIVVAERLAAIKVPNAALRFLLKSSKGLEEKTPRGLQKTKGLGLGGQSVREKWKKLAEILGLNENQRAQIAAILSENRKRVLARIAEGVSPEEIRSEVKQLRMSAREKILPLLEPDQRDKFQRWVQGSGSLGGKAGQVWTLDPKGKPLRVEVETGITDGTFTEILGGDLHPGQQVILGVMKPTGRRSGRTKWLGF